MYKLPEGMESKYRFVTIASLRAEQLQAGATPRVDSTSRKPTVVAQQEIAEGVVAEWRPEEEGLATEETPEEEEDE